MSDEDLRELERRFRETGLLADEGEWLRARVRHGSLATEQLLVAAWCGHPAARTAAGAAGDLSPPATLSLHVRQWLSGENVDFHAPLSADPWAELALDTRVALAAVAASIAVAGPLASAGEEALRGALEAWVRAGADPLTVPNGRPIPNTSPEYGPVDLLTAALGYPRHMPDEGPGTRGAQKEYDSYRVRWWGALEIAERRAPDADVRAAARRALIDWALAAGRP